MPPPPREPDDAVTSLPQRGFPAAPASARRALPRAFERSVASRQLAVARAAPRTVVTRDEDHRVVNVNVNVINAVLLQRRRQPPHRVVEPHQGVRELRGAP